MVRRLPRWHLPQTRYQSTPKVCRIAGKDVTLHWRDISPEELRAKQAPLRPRYEDIFSIRPFDGNDGAWVRLSSFEAHAEQAGAFTRVISQAPSLRQKKVIVVDLRANGGGPYQWFMGFLRSLYGEDFTNYYARERLKIQGVYLDVGQSKSKGDPGHTSANTANRAPADPVLEATEAHFTSFAGRYGQHLQRSERVSCKSSRRANRTAAQQPGTWGYHRFDGQRIGERGQFLSGRGEALSERNPGWNGAYAGPPVRISDAVQACKWQWNRLPAIHDS